MKCAWGVVLNMYGFGNTLKVFITSDLPMGEGSQSSTHTANAGPSSSMLSPNNIPDVDGSIMDNMFEGTSIYISYILLNKIVVISHLT